MALHELEGGYVALSLALKRLPILVVLTLNAASLLARPPEAPAGASALPLERSVLVEGLLVGESQPFGPVTHIVFGELDRAPGPELGIAGKKGAVLLQPQGSVAAIQYEASAHGPVRIIDVEGNGECQFLDTYTGETPHGPYSWEYFDRDLYGIRLFDHQGRTAWKYVPHPPHRGSIEATARHGDVDGDGTLDFIVSCGWVCGLQRVDANGQRVWKRGHSEGGSLAVADLDGDGRDEILVRGLEKRVIRVLDGEGSLQREIRTPTKGSVRLARWPSRRGPFHLVVSDWDREKVRLLDLSGKEVAVLDAPVIGLSTGGLAITPVRFAPEGLDYLSLVFTLERKRYSPDEEKERSCMVLVYNGAGSLVFQEVLEGGTCGAVAAIPSGPGGQERLLVGDVNRVWQYHLAGDMGEGSKDAIDHPDGLSH